ncbi:hypothetical protein, partial [Acinetobacter sp. LH3_13]|uniref:hypothetical protein n=1 Tax=Acinetobacter sp. LH3_13 TaxID=3434463 RepID=UPI003EBAD447
MASIITAPSIWTLLFRDHPRTTGGVLRRAGEYPQPRQFRRFLLERQFRELVQCEVLPERVYHQTAA